MDSLIENVSYINTGEHFINAMENRMTLEVYARDWIKFINDEKALFDRLVSITVRPNEFIEVMRSYTPVLDEMSIYMNTVNEEYIPDDSLPTYADVYTINEIEIPTKGCKHEVGDIVLVPI